MCDGKTEMKEIKNWNTEKIVFTEQWTHVWKRTELHIRFSEGNTSLGSAHSIM